MVCEDDKRMKRGNCFYCGSCIKCPSPTNCSKKEEHKVAVSVRQRLSSKRKADAIGASPPSARNSRGRRGEKDIREDFERALTLDPKDFQIPLRGFDSIILQRKGSNSQLFYRQVLTRILGKVVEVLCPLHPKAVLTVLNDMKDSKKAAKPKIDKECPVVQNLLEMCLAHEVQVSEVGKSILAMSFPREECVQMLRRGAQTKCNLSEQQVLQLDSLPADADFDSEESLDDRLKDE